MIRHFMLAGLFGLVAIIVGCNQSAGQSSDFQLFLTDAPADEASELLVTFGEIQLVSEGVEGGVVTVSESGGSFDILTLRNGQTALLADTEIPDGRYTQLRFIVKEASITIDGETQPVTIPSGPQSGLKVNVAPALEALSGQASAITLDFNASRVIETGNGAYKLSPTAIRATSVSGHLQGSLQDSSGNALAGGVISIYDANGDFVTETTSDEDGSFKIITLTEGSYRAEVILDGYTSQTFLDVQITANETSLLGDSGVITLVPPSTP